MDDLTYTLTSPSGDVFELGTSAAMPGDFGLLDSTQGFGLAEKDVKLADSAGDGGRLRSVRTPPRSGVISTLVHGATDEELRANFRRLGAAVRYVRGLPLPKLTATFASGDAYELPFLFESCDEKRWPDAIEAPLNVIYPDPYWTAVDALPFVFGASTSTDGLLPYLAELRLTGSTAFGSQVVTNPGDVSAEVVYTLTGPASLVTAQAGSDSWAFGPLAAGEVVTIDTRRNTAKLANGTNVYDRFQPAPRLFALPAGSVDLSVTIAGSTTSSRVTGFFRPRLEVIV